MFKRLRIDRPVTFLDLESTGVRPNVDRIIEFAVLRFAPGTKGVLVNRRVNPEVPIPPTATAVHGIREADVVGLPLFRDIAPRLAGFLGGCDLAGFGIKRFDLPLLVAEFRRAEVAFSLHDRSVIDAMQLYHLREKRDLSAAMTFYCGQPHDQSHRAGPDAWAAAKVLNAQLHRYPDLPATVPELHEHLTEVDLAGRFRLEEGEVVFAFGKYIGHRLKDVARDDPGYLEWMLAGDFLDDVKELVHRHLAGTE